MSNWLHLLHAAGRIVEHFQHKAAEARKCVNCKKEDHKWVTKCCNVKLCDACLALWKRDSYVRCAICEKVL